MTRRRSNGSYTAFEHTHTRFEDGVGRITHTSIDVAVFRPSELACAIISVAEVVGRCLIQRRSASARDGIWFLTAVQQDRFEAWRPVPSSAIRTVDHEHLTHLETPLKDPARGMMRNKMVWCLLHDLVFNLFRNCSARGGIVYIRGRMCDFPTQFIERGIAEYRYSPRG